jgi:hypothetical protein
VHVPQLSFVLDDAWFVTLISTGSEGLLGYNMSRMRSFSMPKIGSSKKHNDAMAGSGSPYQFETSHSRESSGASTSSTPLTPTFSNRSQLWQNSNSSFGTTPESPVNLTKSPLHDLPEDPEERDDGSFDIPRERQDSEYQNDDDPLCICMSCRSSCFNPFLY